jgi:hypothetical protein
MKTLLKSGKQNENENDKCDMNSFFFYKEDESQAFKFYKCS